MKRRNPKIAGVQVPGWAPTFLDAAVARGADPEKVLGYAHFGCVFAHKTDPRWVVKVTRDPTEAPVWRKIQELQKDGEYMSEAFAFVKSVDDHGTIRWRGRDWPATIVVREAVDPADREKRGAWAHPAGNLARSLRALDFTQDWGRRFHSLKKRHLRAVALGKYMDAASEVGVEMPYIGEAMAHLLSKGLVFQDIHRGNVGKSVADWGGETRGPGTWIVFDPGHTPVLSPEEIDRIWGRRS